MHDDAGLPDTSDIYVCLAGFFMSFAVPELKDCRASRAANAHNEYEEDWWNARATYVTSRRRASVERMENFFKSSAHPSQTPLVVH